MVRQAGLAPLCPSSLLIAFQDFAEGHVKGAINIPSERFRSDEQVDAALQSLAAAGKERIVVHCALSQQRGPNAARRYPKP